MLHWRSASGSSGLDRWLVAPLIPSISRDLHLSNQDVGNVLGILGLSWGVFAIFLGNLTDQIGRRAVVIGVVVLLCDVRFDRSPGTVGALLLIRAAMGATEGAYIASAVAATGDASHPNRRGMNQGLMLSMFPLLGFGLGPVLATQVEAATGSWRQVFYLAALPGFIVAAILFLVLKEPRQLGLTERDVRRGPVRVHYARSGRLGCSWPWYVVLQTKNVPLILSVFSLALAVMLVVGARFLKSRNIAVAMGSLVCGMSCIFVLGGFLSRLPPALPARQSAPSGAPHDRSGLWRLGRRSVQRHRVRLFRPEADQFHLLHRCRAGRVLADLAGRRLLPGKDPRRCGRTPDRLGGQFWLFYAGLFMVSLFTFGVLTIMTGPVPSESVYPTMIAAAVGFASGTGEISAPASAPPSPATWPISMAFRTSCMWG